MDRFNDFVFYLQICGRDWESLAIGRHPFETSYANRSTGPVNAGSSFQDDVTMDWDVITHANRMKDDTKLQVKALRLPVMHTTLNVKKTWWFVNIRGPRTRLSRPRVTNFWRFLTQPAATWDTYNTVARLLNPLLSGFDSLQCLTLRGVTFEAEEMQKFLLGLAATLRTLRLVDCYCPDSYDALLAKTKDSIAPALALTGVEIWDLRFRHPMRPTDARTLRGETREHRAMRAMKDVWSAEVLATRGRYLGGDIVSPWSFERHELEAAMLGGSINRVTRRFSPASAEERYRWFDFPTTQKVSFE